MSTLNDPLPSVHRLAQWDIYIEHNNNPIELEYDGMM